MSRMQNILEKAERDGVVHRMRAVPEPAAAVAAIDARPMSAPAPPAPEAAGATLAGRVVAGARLSRSLVAAQSDHVAAEQYRALRTRIMHADTGSAVNVMLVTSPGSGDGKSLTVANLGLTMAQEYQRRICIVDANLRTPQQHELFGVPDTPGLSDILSGDATLDESLVTLEEHHITILPAGSAPTHPAELLGTTTMRRTLDTLRSRFDCVIFDTPATTPLADVGVLTPLVDSVLIIVRAGVTSKPAIHDAIAAIEPGKLLGVVLNDAIV